MIASASQLQEILYRHDYAFPKFIKINDNWGFKMWHHPKYDEHLFESCPSCYKQERDTEYRNQEWAATWGLAPLVGAMLSFPHPTRKATVFGFITELCKDILCDRKEYRELWWGWHSNGELTYDKYWKKYNDCDDHNSIDFDYYGLPNMSTMLMDIGFEYAEDLHSSNLGYMPDGSFVCIDFDHCYLPPNPITRVDKLLSANEYALVLG